MIKKFLKDIFAGNDFNNTESFELVLDIGIASTCTSLSTFDDDLYEDDESFFATLSSTNENITLSASSATITITDNDGECFCCRHGPDRKISPLQVSR